MLVIAESISQPDILKGLGARYVSWISADAIKASDNEIVTIDTRVTPISDKAKKFKELRRDLETLLAAGGAVFALCGPTVKWQEGKTTYSNYDFLPGRFLYGTGLQYSESREGTRFRVMEPKWQGYFAHVNKYWKVVPNIIRDQNGARLQYVSFGETLQISVRVLAQTQTTSEVIGCLIPWEGGTIGLLAPPEDLVSALAYLHNLGCEIYKQNVERLGEYNSPSWIDNFKTSEQKELLEKKQGLLSELERIQKDLRHFTLASSCLYSTGRTLERAVSQIFLDMGWNFDDLTEKGEPIDYVIHGKPSSRDLLVALTGTTGFIGSDNKKIAQLLGALAQVGGNQRLVFLVNALADEDPKSRATENCITPEALKRLTKLEICVLLAHDLYKLWKGCLEKRYTPDQVFDMIHATSGVLKDNKK